MEEGGGWKEVSSHQQPFLLHFNVLLGSRCCGGLAFSSEEVNQLLCYLTQHQELGQCKAVVTPPEPTEAFDRREPFLKEVQNVLQNSLSRSAPGLSGTPYNVYKHFPRLLHRLWKSSEVFWRRGKTVQQWSFAKSVDPRRGGLKEHQPVLCHLAVQCGRMDFLLASWRSGWQSSS